MGFYFCSSSSRASSLAEDAVQDSPDFKEAQEMEKRLEVEGKTRVRESIWKIPGAKRRIVVGWLLYTANACGYWGITYFLTTFIDLEVPRYNL